MAAALPVYFALPRGSLILDWAGPAEALRIASQEMAERGSSGGGFALHFVAPRPESESSVGALLAGLAPLPETLPEPAWVVVVGKTGTGRGNHTSRADEAEDRAVVQWLGRLRPGHPTRPGLRLVTVCSGALLAADAGLLDGRRCTTHHGDLDDLRRRAPRALVAADRVFVQDGEVWSSAGVTAGIDLALHLVADHCGPVVAARTAQRMAVALRRGPDDPQLSPFLAHRQHLNARLHSVQDAVSRAPREDWTADRMAAVARVTPRTLNRLFTGHAGTTPLAYLRGIRLAVARAALAAGSPVAAAAEVAGFSSDLQMRRAWRALGAPGAPSDILQAAGHA
ncbi:MAG: GlxA family transcriptional regulator [Aquabacterium sp.]